MVMMMTTPTSPGADVSLDSPEASFETNFVNKTVYPETAQRGLGVRGAVPYARFWIEAWFRITVGDLFRLYDGNGRILASDTVKSLTNRYFLDVPKAQLADGLVDLFFWVKRIGSGQESVSPFLKYEVDTRTPAGIDSRPDLLGHDGLRVRPESLAQYSAIDPSYLTTGMFVLVDKFQNAGVNTEVEVNLGGVPTNFILSPADVASPGPWRWFLPPSVFSQISQFGQLALLVTATNKVGNIPAGVDRYSPPFFLNSELNPRLYYGPLLLVANVETTRLDMATVGAQLLSVAVTPDRSARITTPPNQIDVKVILIDGDNNKQTVRLPTQLHLNVRGEVIDAATLREPLRQLALRGGGFALISFELRTATGALVGQSGSTQVQVLALQLPTTYPAPEFDNMVGPQTVNPQNYPNGAYVRVAFANMNAAQTIRLSALFANGSSIVLGTLPGSGSGVVPFLFSTQLLNQSAGQVIRLSYEVTEGGITTPSLAQELTVQAQSGGANKTVAVGLGPHPISITRDGRRAFVPCRDSNSISVVDILSGQVITTIFGVSSPFASVLSPDDSRLYVGSYHGGSYFVISTTNYQVLKTVPLTGGGNVSGLALTADGARLFVACTNTGVVHVYLTATDTNINRIPTASEPFGLTVNPEQTQVWIAFQSAVGIINANGYGGLLAKIPGVGRTVHIAFNPGNQPVARAYVADESGISVVNPLTNAIVGKITVPNAWGVAINPNAPELWVSGSDPGAVGASAYRSSVYVIDTNTLQVTKRHTGFGNAAHIAFVPNSRVALVANQATGQVSFVATDRKSVV